MITEDKILRLYQQAMEQAHPDAQRAIFGRLGLTDANTEYEHDGKIGLFGVDKKKAAEIGLDQLDNVDANFRAMMYWDQRHISEVADINQALAMTAGENDVDAYRQQLDKAVAVFQEKLLYEDGQPIGFKHAPEEIEEDDPLEDVASVDEAKDTAKALVAEASNASKQRALLGLDIDAKQEYDRLVQYLDSYIKHSV